MNHKHLGKLVFAILLISVLLVNTGLSNGRATPSSPDTAWIETLHLEQTSVSGVSAAEMEAPLDAGSDAAILAAQILLMPIYYFIQLPLVIR